MSAGLPLLIITLLSCIVIGVWFFRGPAPQLARKLTAAGIVAMQVLCWAALGYFGVFSAWGQTAMGAAFVVSIMSLFVPWLWRVLVASRRSRGTAA